MSEPVRAALPRLPEILSMADHFAVNGRFVPRASLDGGFEVRANIVMMCGCTISDDSLWDGSAMQAEALLRIDGESAGTPWISRPRRTCSRAGWMPRVPATTR